MLLLRLFISIIVRSLLYKVVYKEAYCNCTVAVALLCTPSGPFYLAQVRMTRSSRLHFDHSFTLYYIIYAYKLIIIG